MAQRVYLKKSSVVDKTPNADNINFGELAINYASGTGKAFLAAKKYNGTMAKFHEDDYNDAKFATKSNVTEINSKLSNYALSATVKTQISAITTTIEDNEYVVAQAFNDVNDRLDSLEGVTSGLGGEYLTIASATQAHTVINSDINTIKSDYMLKKSYVASGTTAGRWEVSIPNINSYFDGLTIHVRIGSSYNGTSNLLNVNGLGNRFVYWRRGSISTSHIGQWAEVTLVYREDAHATGYAATFNYGGDIVSGTTYKAGWVCDYAYYSDGNYNNMALYERRYAGNRLTRYQIIAIDKDERLQPLTRVDTGDYNTGTTKPVNTVAIRPERFFYRNTTGIVGVGGVEPAQVDYTNIGVNTARYTFNSDLSSYRAIYLKGSYDAATNLFTLDTGVTSFYVQVPTNTSDLTLSNYFVSGWYYIFLGATYSSTNYFQLVENHELFYFDGTNLIKYSKKYTDDKITQASSDVSAVRSLAQSAYTYANTVNTNLTTKYYTSAQTSTQIANASARTVESAKTYVDNNFVKKSDYNTYTGGVSSTLSSLEGGINFVSSATKTLSGSIVTNYAAKDLVKNVSANTFNVAVTSAKTYGDNTFVKKTDYNTYTGGVSSTLSQLQGGVDFVSSATKTLSGSVVANYATKDLVKAVSANTYNAAVAASNQYANDTFVQKTTYNTFTGNVSSDINTLAKSAMTVSANVIALSAEVASRLTSVYRYKGTKDTAAQLPATGNEDGDVWNVVAASGNTPAGTNYAWVKEGTSGHWDALGGSIDLSGFFTSAAAASMESRLNSADEALSKKIDAVSGTVKATYALSSITKSVVDSATLTAINSAYTKSTGYTKDMTDAISGTVNTYKTNNDSFHESVRTGLSAWTYTNAATHNEVKSASGNAVTTANNYTDSKIKMLSGLTSGTFLTIASANSIVTTLNSNINNVNNKLTGFSATVMSDYATETEASAYAAAALGNAMAYTDSKISGLSIGNYVTHSQFGSYSSRTGSDISSIKSNYALSAVVKSQISGINSTIEADEAILTDLSNKLKAVSGFSSGYILSSTVVTLQTNLNNAINNASTSARNAQIYAEGVSATVKNTFATKDLLKTVSSNTFALAVTSAKTYGDNTFVKKTDYNTYTGNVNSTISQLQGGLGYVSGVVSSITTNYYTKTQTNTQIANASASTLSAAQTYGDNTFVKKTDYNTYTGNVSSTLSQLQGGLGYVSGVVSSITTNYYTKTQTNTEIANASSRTLTAANTYADGKFLTASSAASLATTLRSEINKYGTLSASVVNDYVTKATDQTITGVKTFSNGLKLTAANNVTATSYRAIPYSVDGDDTKIQYVNTNANSGLTYNPKYGLLRTAGYVAIGKTANDLLNGAGGTTSRWSFASSASVTSINSDVNALKTGLSAWTYNNAASKTLVGQISANTYNAATAYTNSKINALSALTSGTFLTVTSANSIVTTLNSSINGVNTKVTTLSASVVNNYATDAKASNYAAAALADAMDYTDSKITGLGIGDYLTVSSANSMVTTLNSNINTAKNAANSAFNFTQAVCATTNNNFTTKTLAGQLSANTYNKVTAWTETRYITSANAVTAINGVNSSINNVNNLVTGLSASVINNVSAVFRYKGTKSAANQLPSNAVIGDTWNVTAASGNTPAGTNWTWNGSAWDPLAGTVDLSPYLTRASASSIFDTVNSNVSKANSLANSAYTYANTINGTRYTSAQTNTQIANASARTFTSAKTYADATFLTKASAGTMYDTLASSLSNFALSGTVNSAITDINNVILENEETTAEALNDLNTRYNNMSQLVSTFTSRFFPTASATSVVTTLSSNIADAAELAQSAYTFAESISTGMGSYATTTLVGNVSANTVAIATNSALTYVGTTYLTRASASTIFQNVNSAVDARVKKAGDTMTGNLVFSLGANGYADSYSSSGINMGNSNIVGVNSIYTADASDNGAEGIHFFRDATHVDTFRAAAGVLKFFPNRTVGSTAGTEYNVYHTGNLSPVTTTRKVNGHALSADVTVTKTDIGLGSVENTALSTWTGNTSVKSVGTITAGTWNGTKIANAYLVNNAVAIDGQVVALGTSATTKNVSQSLSTTANYRPILIGYTSNASAAALSASTTGVSYVAKNLYVKPSTGEIHAGGYVIDGKAATDLLNATGGVTTVASIRSGYVPTTRKVNGHALSADVTVTKSDLSLGNVENTALSTWTGNTSIKSVNTVTAGTWNATPIATTYLAKSAITINGTAVGLGGSVTLSTTDKNVGQASSTAAERRALVLGTTTAATGTALGTTSVTGETAFNKDIYAIPSTGELNSKQLRINEAVTLQYNSSTQALDFIFS